MPKALNPKLPTFAVTVLCDDGSRKSLDMPGEDLEDAAKRAAKRLCLRGYKTLTRNSGEPGGPGWFQPYNGNKRWPFAGPSFKVEPKGAPTP